MRLVSGAFIALVAGALLAACGGSSDDNNDGGTAPPPAASPTRGTLTTTPPTLLKSYGTADLLLILGGSDAGQALLDLALAPKCGVDAYQIQYNTVGAKGESATASGALMVPTGTDAACQGPRPIVVYDHGTSPSRAYNIADLTNDNNTEGVAVATVFAAQGYIVVAPNYAGYDTSSLSYHPYLNADQQSKDTIDAISAARSALPTSSAPTITDNGKLFLTGYSQGGYVAMATHRALQAAGVTVTASAPLSGPYALTAFGDAIFRGDVSASAPLNLVLLISSYQQSNFGIYSATTDVFEAPYATGIDKLLPSTTAVGDLEAAGKIPSNSAFSLTPPAPEYAALTPSATPPEFAALYARGFGTDNLITNAYRLSYLRDTDTAPDGGFPTVTDGLPPANPSNALRRALKLNDLRSWTPNVPVLLCGGNNDPTVFFLNTQLMQNYWTSHVPAGAVTVLDVDSAVASDDPYAGLKTGFAAAKDAVRV
ncbi:MAG: prolyl oligopeptidase family serine peptidase, partial [Gammaproteobacteria bacterium]